MAVPFIAIGSQPLGNFIAEDRSNGILVILSEPAPGDVTFDFAFGPDPDGNSAEAADFEGGVFPSGTATIPPGQIFVSIRFFVPTDDRREEPETFRITLSDIQAAAIAGGGDALTRTKTIFDADPEDPRPFVFGPGFLDVKEGSVGTMLMLVVLTLNVVDNDTFPVTASWHVVVDGAAESANAADFVGDTLPSGTLTIPLGATETSFTIPIQGDSLVEPLEFFTIVFDNVSGARPIQPISAAIWNDDPASDFDDFTFGTSIADSIDGLRGDDVIVGLAGDDTLLGNAGRDTLWGGDGNDSLAGGDEPDLLIGEAGNDTLVGDGEAQFFIANDTLFGGAGDDLLVGDRLQSESFGGLDDALYGEDGNDTLFGGIGVDVLSGGRGADVFAYRDNSFLDLIADFNRAEGDKIQIARNINGSGLTGPEQLLQIGDPGGTFVFLGKGIVDAWIFVVGVAQLQPSDFVFV